MVRGHLFSTVMVFAFLAPAAAPAATVQDVVNQVSQTQYTHYLSDSDFLYTHTGQSRAAGTSQHDLAKTNIYNTLNSFGLSTAIESGTYGSYAYSNVVATLTGTLHPEQVYVVGAHYDSVSCPGADDDASGVAGILEAARVLSQYQFSATIKFIAFDREENGMVGSYGYVATHASENVLGMISMDMIAFNFVNPTYYNKAWVYYSSSLASQAVCQDLANALTTYTDIVPAVNKMGSSDHVPFDAYGSALLIEGAMTKGAYANPYYHKTTDAIESTYTYDGETYHYIDYAYAVKMTCGAVGYLAAKAQLVPEPAAIVMLLVGAFAYAVFRRKTGS